MKKLVIILIVATFFADSFGCPPLQLVKLRDYIEIEIDYASNKNLLNAVLLFPDSMFPLGGWKFEERKEWYNEIKSNNLWTIKEPFYFNLFDLKPNSISFSILDGLWTISLYETFDNSFIVISHQIIGDGNFVNIVEARDNEIIDILDFENLFGSFSEQIKLSDFSQECNQKLIDVEFEHYFWLFEFYFSDVVEISCSWLITKDDFKECLKGNVVLYKFNPETKKFEIEKIYWE